MTTPRAVISGASIAGLSAAYWLRRTGWDVTILENAPEFRDGGQNVDVRGVGRDVLELMGLFDTVKARNTTETATVLVDESGTVITELPSDGPDGATAELEVLRGDFARALLEALPPGVDVHYDDSVADVAERPDHVEVTTRSGRTLTAELVIVAEGVRSSTRDLVFPGEAEARELGITMAFGTIPRTETDDDRWRWFTTVGGRQVHLRPDNHGTTRAILAFAGDETLLGLDREQTVVRLRDRFADARWEAPRVLDGFAGSNDLYVDRLTQIRMQRWYHGRVCLAGDAAWCVTPLGGGGASLALVSGYVLAAYLSTEPDQAAALAAWQRWMRPLVESVQKLPPGIDHLAYPRTKLGLKLSGLVTKVVASKPMTVLTSRLTQTMSTDQPLPKLRQRAGAADG